MLFVKAALNMSALITQYFKELTEQLSRGLSFRKEGTKRRTKA